MQSDPVLKFTVVSNTQTALVFAAFGAVLQYRTRTKSIERTIQPFFSPTQYTVYSSIIKASKAAGGLRIAVVSLQFQSSVQAKPRHTARVGHTRPQRWSPPPKAAVVAAAASFKRRPSLGRPPAAAETAFANHGLQRRRQTHHLFFRQLVQVLQYTTTLYQYTAKAPDIHARARDEAPLLLVLYLYYNTSSSSVFLQWSRVRRPPRGQHTWPGLTQWPFGEEENKSLHFLCRRLLC